MRHRPVTQPVDKLVTIVGRENLVERFKSRTLADLPGSQCEQVQVVVAEHIDDRVAQRPDEPQCL